MNDLLTITWQAVLALAFVHTGFRFLRRRDGESRDIFLMFTALAGTAADTWLTFLVGTPVPYAGQVGTLALAAHPYLMLRVIDHWRPIPQGSKAIAGLGLLGAWGLLLAAPAPRPGVVTALVASYFLALEAYAVYLLVDGARITRGPTKGRLGSAAIGSGFLAAAIAVALANATWSILPPVLEDFPSALALAGFVAFYGAFAPPRPLIQAWGLSTAYRVIQERESGEGASEKVDAALDGFVEAVDDLGAPDAYIVSVDRLGSVETRCSEALREIPLELFDEPLVQEAMRRREPEIVRDATTDGPLGETLPAHARANDALVLPLVNGDDACGAALLLYEDAPLFVKQTADILATLGEDVAASIALERHEQEQRVALEREKAALERADRIKDEFLATMSHEIRTPLNAVLGMAELLEQSDLDDAQREKIDTIQASGDLLLAIIDDILNLSKIEAGEVELDPMPVAVEDLVEGCRGMVADRARGKGLDLRVDIGQQVPARFQADADRVRQLLVNLLTNAVKFTDEGHVIVRVRAEERDSGEGIDLRIEVEDTGVGIPEDKFDEIFEPFRHAGPISQRSHDGTGLGLAISKRLVELMDGEITVESTQGEGSTFRARFPVEPVQPGEELPRSGPEVPEEAMQRSTPGHVLVVDDNAVNRRVAAAMLEEMGCEVEQVSSGPKALEALRESPFDVVLLDIQMPEMDGFEVATRIQEDLPEERRPKLLALSAHAEDSYKRKADAAGFDDYVTKPVRLDTLQRGLDQVASQRSVG